MKIDNKNEAFNLASLYKSRFTRKARKEILRRVSAASINAKISSRDALHRVLALWNPADDQLLNRMRLIDILEYLGRKVLAFINKK